MHPALSIIAFTTVSGLGYGLAISLGGGFLDPSALSTKIAHVTALVLIGAGLMSSTLHLGNPQRAWRAFSQWRSSWLSREGVMAVLTFVPLAASAGFSLWESRYVPAIGMLGAFLSMVTVYCTAMIYASLKSVPAWHTPLTPLCYLFFSLSGGFGLATLFAVLGDGRVVMPASLAIAFLALAWSAKLFWRNRMNTLRPTSTPETATGLGFIGKVRLFERPHINDNYLTSEMGFRVARKHAAKLAAMSFVLGGGLPILLLAVVLGSTAQPVLMFAAFLAVLSHVTGMLVERWLFFAEARHAVMNYYST